MDHVVPQPTDGQRLLQQLRQEYRRPEMRVDSHLNPDDRSSEPLTVLTH